MLIPSGILGLILIFKNSCIYFRKIVNIFHTKAELRLYFSFSNCQTAQMFRTEFVAHLDKIYFLLSFMPHRLSFLTMFLSQVVHISFLLYFINLINHSEYFLESKQDEVNKYR